MALVCDRVIFDHLTRASLASLWDSHVVIANVTQSTAGALAAARATLPHDAPPPSQRNTIATKTIPWLYKLAVAMLTPFEETVFLDTDVLLISPSLIDDLLARSLRVGDFAAPLDPLREPRQPPMKHSMRDFVRGVPPMCMALYALRSGVPSVRRLLESAARRMLLRDSDEQLDRFRHGDQEFVWFELFHGPPDPELRVLFLPEEYYCPTCYVATSIERTLAHLPWRPLLLATNPCLVRLHCGEAHAPSSRSHAALYRPTLRCCQGLWRRDQGCAALRRHAPHVDYIVG